MATPLIPRRELQTVFTHQQGNQAENSRFLCNLNFFIEISIWPTGRKDFLLALHVLFFSFLSVNTTQKTQDAVYFKRQCFMLIFEILIMRLKIRMRANVK